MPIREHPSPGTILVCHFDGTFKEPEMVKTRCVIILSPKIVRRAALCTVVCLSETTPDPVQQYHAQIDIRPRLPSPWNSDNIWIKGDMIYSVGFHRLDLIRLGKDRAGNRIYRVDVISEVQMKTAKSCVLKGLGLSTLTKHM
jgi:mRNA interferase MazF